VVDVSIPYDATTCLAYVASNKSIPYDQFNMQCKEDTIAQVQSKQQVCNVATAAAQAWAPY